MSFFERSVLSEFVYPESTRIVPTRLVLINYWLYQRQVFYFAAGRLFLTGDNGSGKSTALTATITSLLDGDTSPSRMDPFGGGKRNLMYYLLGNSEAGFEYDARRAYLALEFRQPDGRFITVGLGLQASKGSRELQKWGFALPDRVEIDGGLMLVDSNNEPLSKRQLRDALEVRGGRYVEGVEDYANLVRRSLYPQCSSDEYAKLIELLLTLRGAKLGREVKPSQIEALLRQSLPRLDAGILEQLREGIEGMDRHARRLEDLEMQLGAASQIAVAHFEAALARARHAAQRQHLATAELERYQRESAATRVQIEDLQTGLQRDAALEQTQSSEQAVLELERTALEAQLRDADGALREQELELEKTRQTLKRELDRLRGARERLERDTVRLEGVRVQRGEVQIQLDRLEAALRDVPWFVDGGSITTRTQQIELASTAWTRFERDTEALSERELMVRKATTRVTEAREQLELDTERLENILRETALQLAARAAELLSLSSAAQREYQQMLENILEPSDALVQLEPLAMERLAAQREQFEQARGETRGLRVALERVSAELLDLKQRREVLPALPSDRAAAAALLSANGIAQRSLYQCLKPRSGANPADLAGLEAALAGAGLLTALVVTSADQPRSLELLRSHGLSDALLHADAALPALGEFLEPEDDAPSDLLEFLRRASGDAGSSIAQNLAAFGTDGAWRNGLLSGVTAVGSLRFIGAAARERERERQLLELSEQQQALQMQLDAAAQLEQTMRDAFERLERGWQSLREARPERVQRSAASNAREASRDRFEDRSTQQLEALQALQVARELALSATQALERSLEPLGLTAQKSAFVAAQQQLAVVNATCAERSAAQASLAQLEESTQRGISDLAQRQLEITDLEGSRLELEQRRDSLDAIVKEMRLQLDNPDIKAWRERLNRVKARGSELNRALTELTKVIARATGQLEAAQLKLPEQISQLERSQGRLHQAELALQQTLGAHARVRTADLTSTLPLEVLEQTAQTLEASLDKSFYGLKHALETPETFLPVLEAHQPRFTLEGQAVTADALSEHLERELIDAQRLLTEEEARVFHDELVRGLIEKLDLHLREARAFVGQVSATLADLRFHDERLDLELERSVTGGLSELIDGIKDPSLQGVAWQEKVGAAVRELVTRLRQQPNPDLSFPQALEAALDYREWYGFKFFSLIADRRVEITDRRFQSRSGGERSAVLYTFMFAALGARFGALGADVPRLVGLDEAFAGMDPHNIAALYQIMGALNLSLIATSPSDIYISRALPAAAAYRLFRISSADGDGVASIARLWNGARSLDMGTA